MKTDVVTGIIGLPKGRVQDTGPAFADCVAALVLATVPDRHFGSGCRSNRVSATGPGNPPAVRVWTGKTVRFGSRTVQKPNPQHLGRPNPDPYPSTRGFCRVWLDPSVPISGSSFRVFLFMVAFRYPTVLCNILTLVHHCLCSIYWLPLKSKRSETCSLLHHEVECELFIVLHH